jgi:hypothetical protein
MALALAALGGGAYLVLFQRAYVFSLFNMARGYPPAKTPQECVDGFKKAIENRDYAVASDVYCTGDYAEQLKKASEAAHALGTAIDNLKNQMKNKGFDSDRALLLLTLMEPLPTKYTTVDIKKASDTKASTVLKVDGDLSLKSDPSWSMNVDSSFYRALCGGAVPANMAADLLLVGEKDKAWRLSIAVPAQMRAQVDRLNRKYKDYVLVIDKMKLAVRNDPMTKHDFEDKLKQELERAAKD